MISQPALIDEYYQMLLEKIQTTRASFLLGSGQQVFFVDRPVQRKSLKKKTVNFLKQRKRQRLPRTASVNDVSRFIHPLHYQQTYEN